MTFVLRAGDAEVVGQAPSLIRLLADASQTNGALTAQRVTLSAGADGAVPHRHTRGSEMFYVLRGVGQVLSGDDVLVAQEGDLVVVPPDVVHAFGAAPGHDLDLLIVLTPGIERFEYFRLLGRLGRGEATLEELLESQDRFDNHFVDSPPWTAARR
jgi:quercetin dioxygenase-like cupin family protein